MKIYILKVNGVVIGIYSTEEKALSAREAFNNGYEPWARHDKRYTIIPYEVDAEPSLGKTSGNWRL